MLQVMPRRSAIYWVAILTLSVLAGCGAPDIDSASVERVLSTLSADSMQGRRAFTPAADRTVEFIRNEFEEIGLQPFGDLATHRQALSVRQITVDSGRVVLDGREVS